jgi:hypothetical protein
VIDPATKDEMLRQLEQLPAELQRRVLEFARSLAPDRLQGTAGSSLLRFAGTMPPQDAAEIRQAIEDGCEQVHADRW